MTKDKEVHRVDCISFGSCTFDLLLKVDKVPMRDERVAASVAKAAGGGPAATAAVAIRRLGASVIFVSAVGDDAFGEMTRAELSREGMDVGRIQVLPQTTSTVSSVVIDSTGARSMAAFGGCIQDIRLDRIDWATMPTPRAVLLDGNNPNLARAAARWARSRTVPVLLDGGNIPADELKSLLELADIYIPDLQSARMQLGSGLSPAEMCRAFSSAGPGTVCITLGEEGSVALDKGEFHTAPPCKDIPIVDTTGAGDNFHGAFQYCRLQGWDMPKTLAFSNAFAALTCRDIGGRSAIPSRLETEQSMAGLHA